MKRILVTMFVLAAAFSSCKTMKSKKAQKSEPTVQAVTQTDAAPKVFSVPEVKPPVRETPAETTYARPESDSPVSIRRENFTFSASDDQNAYGNQNYFVIVGSFSSNENANRFKQELSTMGFKPIVLRSETGYFRVCVDSFSEEGAARSRVHQIRRDYPRFSDAWLLIKQ